MSHQNLVLDLSDFAAESIEVIPDDWLGSSVVADPIRPDQAV